MKKYNIFNINFKNRTAGIVATLAIVAMAAGAAGQAAHANTSVPFSLVVPKTPSLQMTLLQAGSDPSTDIDAATVELTVKPNIDNTAVFRSTDFAISVATSNQTGYNLAMSTTNQALVSGTDTIPTLGAGTYTCTEATGTTCDFTVNHWGYRTGKDAADTFKTVPDSTGLEINRGYAATNGEATTIEIGARVDNTQAAGEYTTTINFIATANPSTYSITYDKGNNTDTVTLPTLNPQTGNLDGAASTSVSVYSTAAARTGYAFGGWCKVMPTTASGNDTCSEANTVAAGGSIDISIDEPDVTLYAIWKINNYSCTKQYKLQNADGSYPSTWTTDTGENLPFGSTCTYSKSVEYYTTQSTSGKVTENGVTLQVELPRTTYALTINKDSYISTVSGAGTYRWGQSVAISATPTSGSEFVKWTLTNASGSQIGTSASMNYTMPQAATTIYANGKTSKLYMQDMKASDCTTAGVTVYDNRDEEPYLVKQLADGNCWMLDNLRLDPATLKVSLSTSNTNMSSSKSFSLPSSTTTGFTDTTADYENARINTNYKTTEVTGYGAGARTVGVYYNYCAASAGTYCMARGSGSGSAEYDICPKGWKMPTGDTSKGSYYYLFNTGYSGNKTATDTGSLQYNLSTPLSGYFYGGSQSNQGSGGYFWSSTYDDGYGMRYLYVYATFVYPRDYYGRYYGLAMRCILK